MRHVVSSNFTRVSLASSSPPLSDLLSVVLLFLAHVREYSNFKPCLLLVHFVLSASLAHLIKFTARCTRKGHEGASQTPGCRLQRAKGRY